MSFLQLTKLAIQYQCPGTAKCQFELCKRPFELIFIMCPGLVANVRVLLHIVCAVAHRVEVPVCYLKLRCILECVQMIYSKVTQCQGRIT